MSEFPTLERLRHGIILRTLARAFLSTHYSGYPQDWTPYRSAWFMNIYRGATSKGMGFVRVVEDRCVAYFFDPDSPRNPFHEGGPPAPYDIRPYIDGMPDTVRALLDREVEQSQVRFHAREERTVITSAFWSEGDVLAAAEPWDEVVRHSGGLIHELFMEPDAEFPAWAKRVGLLPEEVVIIQELYQRKVNAGGAPLRLTETDNRSILEAHRAWGRQAREMWHAGLPDSTPFVRRSPLHHALNGLRWIFRQAYARQYTKVLSNPMWEESQLDHIRWYLAQIGIAVPGSSGMTWLAMEMNHNGGRRGESPAVLKRAEEFPSVAELRHGVEQAAKSRHAVVELWWDGTVCALTDEQGSDGTIVFDGGRVVGCFFSKESPRTPFRAPLPPWPYDIERFLEGMPPDLRTDLLPRALDRFQMGYNGIERPVITTAFWSNGERLDAAASWQSVLDHSGDLIDVVLPDS